MAHRALKELSAWLVGVACILIFWVCTILSVDYLRAIPSDIADQISRGMTKSEILAIAGEPNFRSDTDPANKVRGEIDHWLYCGFNTERDLGRTATLCGSSSKMVAA